MDKYIVAIGGGEIGNNDTIFIDKTITELTNKYINNLLFIPTASHDSKSYIQAITDYFGKLNCNVDTLLLTQNTYSYEYIKQKVIKADIIYVGGGDTAYMMEVWGNNRMKEVLQFAYNRGTILSGLSAGAICWALSGHSDSQSFHSDKWVYTKVNGLGLIPTILCPHYNEKGREHFDIMLQHENSSGIALENRTALFKKNNYYKILREDTSCKAYWIYSFENEVIKTEIGSKWFKLNKNKLEYV